METAANNLDTRDDIDFESTLSTFMDHNLTSLVTFIMNSRESDSSFGLDLHARIRRLLHELIVLGDHCLGEEAFTRFIQLRLNEINGDVNQLVMNWMSQTTIGHLQTIRRVIVLTPADVAHYVIKRRTQHKMDTSSQLSHASSENEEAFESAEEGDAGANSSSRRNSGAQARLVASPCTGDTVGGGQSTQPHSSPKVACEAEDLEQSPAARGVLFPVADQGAYWPDCGDAYTSVHAAPPPTEMALHASRCAQPASSEGPPPTVSIGSESWHEVVPEEWIPVITRDVTTQQRQLSARPLSDAYLAGMPANKRRKIIDETRPSSTVFSQPEQSLPDAVIQTAGALGIEPITSAEHLAHDLRSNEPLHESFHNQVREDVRKRCKEDQDLLPLRHKNTEKYFGNKK